jgi:hypothetical protein
MHRGVYRPATLILVPSVVGMTLGDADQKLTLSGLKRGPVSERIDLFVFGRVETQNPLPDALVSRTRTVALSVASPLGWVADLGIVLAAVACGGLAGLARPPTVSVRARLPAGLAPALAFDDGPAAPAVTIATSIPPLATRVTILDGRASTAGPQDAEDG